MPIQRLIDYLDQNRILYKIITHSPAYTAQATAQAAHVHGMDFMKAVIARVDGKFRMIVLPAPYRVDTEGLKEIFKAGQVELATETEFSQLIQGCEPGAIPPFGGLFEMETWVASCFGENQSIAFNAGSHAQIIKMNFKDFVRLSKAKALNGGYAAPSVSMPTMKEHTGKRFHWH